MIEKKIKNINNYLSKIYHNNKTIDFDKFIDIIYDDKTFYIMNKVNQLDIIGLEDDENFFPSNGVLSIEIENIIDFYNNLDNDGIKKDDIPISVINSANILSTSIIHGINIYNFNYNREDIDEIIHFIYIYNNINNFIEIDNITLLLIFNSNLNLDNDYILELLLNKIDDINVEKKYNYKKYKKTNDIIQKFKSENREDIALNSIKEKIGKIPIKKNPYL